MGLPLDAVDPTAPAIETTWDQEWEQQQLKRALEDVRESYRGNNTFPRPSNFSSCSRKPVNAVRRKLQNERRQHLPGQGASDGSPAQADRADAEEEG